MSGVVIGETLRRHVTNVGYAASLALLAILSLGVSVFDRPATLWPSLVTLLALIAGSGAIGPELSSGTLQLILVKPLTRAAYLLSRVTGIVLAVWLAAIVCAAFEMTGRALWGDGMPFVAIGAALLNVMVVTLLAVSLLALLGSLTRAWLNVAIYFAVMIGIMVTGLVLGLIRQSASALGRFLARHTGVDRVLSTIDRNLFPESPPTLEPQWVVMVLSNAERVMGQVR